ncbi:MAG: hypothetical protein ND866_09670 [Pyrinomonadaceae bacterium]|nr:hypothetical protein [Pyrinomonadaceae bacterium]
MSESNIILLERMAQVGMNAAITKFGGIAAPVSEYNAAFLKKWADECKRLNLAFVPVFNWWSVDDATWLKNYNHVVTESGKGLDNTPCPYTQDFWDRSIAPRFVAISQALGEGTIAAVGVDMEMYGAESLGYEGGCYCDICFARYLQAKGRSGGIPAPVDRGRIIRDANELDAYQAVQREAARAFAVTCREAVHKVRPGLRLGVMHLDQPIPVQQGLALGFGTADLPVFCLTERTYSSGYTPYIVSVQESFRMMGAFVDLLVGISQSRFSPANIAEQLYYSAHDSYGYWVYTMETFEMPDYHPLPGTPEEHWAVIRQANLELDRLGEDGNYQTSLSMRPFEPPPFPLPWSDFHMYDLIARSGTTSPMPGVWLRNTNWVYFYAKQGDRIEFEMTGFQIGTYRDLPSLGIVSPNGMYLAEGTAKKDQPVVIQTVATETGVYGLVIESGFSAAEISKSSHPYAVHIAQPVGARFVTKLPLLFVALSPETATIEFEFLTYNSAEAVKGSVLAENGAELWSGVVEGPTKISLTKPTGTLVQLRFEQLPDHLLEDVIVRGGQGVLPFAATNPAGLLIGR